MKRRILVTGSSGQMVRQLLWNRGKQVFDVTSMRITEQEAEAEAVVKEIQEIGQASHV